MWIIEFGNWCYNFVKERFYCKGAARVPASGAIEDRLCYLRRLNNAQQESLAAQHEPKRRCVEGVVSTTSAATGDHIDLISLSVTDCFMFKVCSLSCTLSFPLSGFLCTCLVTLLHRILTVWAFVFKTSLFNWLYTAVNRWALFNCTMTFLRKEIKWIN